LEQRRVADVSARDVLRHRPREREVAPILELAARAFGVSKAGVNLLTEDGQQHHLEAVGYHHVPFVDSLAAAVMSADMPVFVLADAQKDGRFDDNPLVNGDVAAARFYAGCKLVSRAGLTIGCLYVLDDMPQVPLPTQVDALASLAERVVDTFELAIRTRELVISLAEVEAMKNELARSNERLSSFAGQVSHDLKTPLTTVSLSLSLIREQLEDGEFGPESIMLLDKAIKGSSRMSELIDDVLDFARLGGTLKTTEVDLDFVLGEVLEDLAKDLADVTLRIERLPTVLGDRAQLRAVLQNLLGNAAKFRAPDRPAEVHVAARHVQRAWRIEITDNGRGVPMPDRTRVFEPLARVDVSVDGSGIGLATCRRIIGAHGGRIGIDPTVVEGARFWFELPD
jgi:signal transduction histidine kinase